MYVGLNVCMCMGEPVQWCKWCACLSTLLYFSSWLFLSYLCSSALEYGMMRMTGVISAVIKDEADTSYIVHKYTNNTNNCYTMIYVKNMKKLVWICPKLMLLKISSYLQLSSLNLLELTYGTKTRCS